MSLTLFLLLGLSSSVLLSSDGEWQSGPDGSIQRHGKGSHVDGPESYTGDWLNDQMHGTGFFQFAAGATYKGSFVADQFHGKGVYVWADGASYDGGWREGKMHGQGKYADADGVTWSGEFFNGKYNTGKCFVPLRETASSRT